MQFAGLALLALAAQILAVPIPLHGRGNSASSMTATEIASYSFYANFVAAAYCSGTVDWSCKACKLIPGFIPYATGGNGGTIPLWYVGWWPAGSTVVVAHEGTDPLQFRSLLTDANIILESLSTTLFPNATSSVKVHSGFRDAHAASATSVLSTVKKIIAERKATKVTLVGHSLGGAIAALDSLYLSLNLPSIIIKGITYGQPRVGNQAFADWMDQTADFSGFVTQVARNILGPKEYGVLVKACDARYTSLLRSCEMDHQLLGQENDTSAKCTVGAVPTIVHGNLIDHLGPYERIWLGTLTC